MALGAKFFEALMPPVGSPMKNRFEVMDQTMVGSSTQCDDKENKGIYVAQMEITIVPLWSQTWG